MASTLKPSLSLSLSLAFAFALAVAPRGARAAPFALSATLGSSMVIQRDQPTSSLWGTAAPGAVVTATISFAGAPPPARATAGADGVWRAALPALPATAAPFNVTFSSDGAADVVLTDVLVGDVVLCSGQSNLQLSLQMALNATAEIAATDAFGPMVRVFYVAGSGQVAPQRDVGAAVRWSRAGKASMGQDSWAGFSGQCWFTGRALFEALGGNVPVGLIESSVGGTAIRQWCPTSALAQCQQPLADAAYGPGPYEHSQLFNGMVNGFGTGPTALKLVLWDQAESDSYPQTPIGYYTCQTIAQINSWRALLRPPAAAAQLGVLPWVFLHLQPYHGSGPCCLEDLRAQQLAALMLPAVGVATAIDLGDPASPYGDVHYRNKQVSGARAAAAALAVAYTPGAGGAAATMDYPAPSFLSQAAYFDAASNTSIMIVTFDRSSDASGGPPVVLLPNASVTCPDGTPPSNCTGLEIIGSDGNTYAAEAQTVANGTLTISARLPPGIFGYGSAYAWSMWPRVLLYGAGGLPMLPWKQGLSTSGTPPPPPQPPVVVRFRFGAGETSCLSTNESAAFPCPGGWANSCPVFLADCALPQSRWIEDPATGFLLNAAAGAGTGAVYSINIDCDQCSAGRVAKALQGSGSDGTVQPHFVGGQLVIASCPAFCLDGGQGAAVPTCEPGEATSAAQVVVAACTSPATQGWTREVVPLN